MNREIIAKAKSFISKKKHEAELKAEDNYNRCLQDPVFSKIDKQLRELVLEIAQAEFEQKETSSLLSKRQILEKARDNSVENNLGKGFSIRPKYDCALCNDTGVVDGSPCSCLKTTINHLLMEESGMSQSFATFANSSFSQLENDEKTQLQLAYSKMEEWCDKTSTTKIKNILIFGPTGVGKSYLVESMASKLIENGHLVLFSTAFNLSNKMLKYHTTFDISKNTIIDPFLNADILIIDDLGTEPILKNVSLEYLYLIVNERTINKKPIIITTNLTIDAMRNRYGERIFSRLMNKQNSIAIRLNGDDQRLKKNGN